MTSKLPARHQTARWRPAAAGLAAAATSALALATIPAFAAGAAPSAD